MNKVFIFLSGLGIGGAIAWKLTSTKYETILNSEIEEMRSYFEEKYSKKEVAETIKVEAKPNIMEYKSIIGTESYTNYSDVKKEEEPPKEVVDGPYVIEPGEFGMMDGYSESYLNYYQDGYLVNEALDVIGDIDDTINLESLNHVNEDSIVYVRDDRRKIDYEVTVNDFNYVPEE